MEYGQKLAALANLKNKMDTYRPLSPLEVKQLEQNIRIKHVWSSAAIEGNTMTEAETAEILNGGLGATIHGKTIKETLEIINLNEAYDYMQDLATKKQPICNEDIRNLNRIATLTTIQPQEEAGKYRNIDVYPYGSESCPYAHFYEIPEKMQQLQAWSNEVQDKLHPVQYATDLHQKFVTIHPFKDGNGRTARLLMNLVLTENGYPVVNVNPSKPAREQYMKALAVSQQPNNDPQPFRNLIADYVETELKNRILSLQYAKKNEEEAQKDFKNSQLDWDKLQKEYEASKKKQQSKPTDSQAELTKNCAEQQNRRQQRLDRDDGLEL